MKEALRSMTEDMMAMIRRKDFFNLALGGETEKDSIRDKIDWNNIRFLLVDERCVPPTSPDSNYGHANHLLLSLYIGGPYPPDQGRERAGYRGDALFMGRKEFLPLFNQMPTFDCSILGVGEDSHTASIFPTTMELLSDSRSVSQHGQYRSP